jgi:hypothetical protein
MPLYKRSAEFVQSDHQAFDATHRAGDTTPFSGIYRCIVCGWEAVSTQGHTLPPQDHHIHTGGQILWRLSAYARHEAAQ